MDHSTPLASIEELERLGNEIAELAVHLDAATARLLDLIREFDAQKGWNNGFASCAAWLTWRVGFSPGAAREHVRVARALGTLSLLSQALARGELSYAKVRALTRVATPETEERLLAVGLAGTAHHVERIVRGWRRVDRIAEAREATRQNAWRALHVFTDDDGTVRIKGRLAPEVGAVLLKALEAAREALHQRRREQTPGIDQPTFEQQQADALALLAETALHQGLDPGAPGERYQVVVHVDAAVLADADQLGQSVLEDGVRVPAGTSQRLACDASRVVMRHDAHGHIVEVGARTRTIPPALRRALQHRDRGCRFPGCGVRFGQGHHIRHWAHGGPTTLSNLAMLCRRHHRAVHEEGYQVERQPDGELQVRHPYGWVIPHVPPSPELPADPAAAIRADNESHGLALALALALAVNTRVPAARACMSGMFLTNLMPIVAVCLVWKFLFHPHGLVNQLLAPLGLGRIDWLTSERLAMPAIIAVTVWRFAPYFMVVFLAALVAIPRDYYEAAAIDGAVGLRRLRHITLPLLRPLMFFVVVVAALLSARIFLMPFLITGGGPGGATQVLSMLIYETGFSFMKMGRAAAISVVLFAIAMVFTLCQMRLFMKGEED